MTASLSAIGSQHPGFGLNALLPDQLRFATRVQEYLNYAHAMGVSQDDAKGVLQPLLSSHLGQDAAFRQARTELIERAYPLASGRS